MSLRCSFQPWYKVYDLIPSSHFHSAVRFSARRRFQILVAIAEVLGGL